MVGFVVESDEIGLMFAIAGALKSFDRKPKIIGIVLAAFSRRKRPRDGSKRVK